jgi:MFS family permease
VVLRRAGLTILAATVLVDMIGFGIVLPLLPFYAESMGATPFAVTLIIASFSATQLVAAPIWGRVSDTRGRRPLLIAGLFASAVSYLIFALADSLAVLLLSRVAAGAAGGTISVAQAYVADSTEGSKRAQGGGFFSQWGLGVPGLVAAGLCATNGAAAVLFLPESRHFEGPARAAREGQARLSVLAAIRALLGSMTRYPLSLLLSVYYLAISSFGAMTSVLALYLERAFEMNASDMGIVFTMAGAVTVVVRGAAIGRIVRRIGEPMTVRIGCVILTLSLLGIPLMPSRWWLGVFVPLFALSTGITFPSLASLVSRATDTQSQGSILGGSQLVGGLGRVVGPIWAGLLFQHLSITSPFFVAAIFVVLGFLLSLRLPSVERIEQAAAEPSGGVG